MNDDVLTKEEREFLERLKADYKPPVDGCGIVRRDVAGMFNIIDRLVSRVSELEQENAALRKVAMAAEELVGDDGSRMSLHDALGRETDCAEDILGPLEAALAALKTKEKT